jgi:RNA polymerase sigma factor (sigma-70 family)
MNHTPLTTTSALMSAFTGERARLVRLCTALTGDAHAAEDLAQETLMEAWRNAHKLSDPAGVSVWLSAIARHVCQRWKRHKGKVTGREVTEADRLPLYLWEQGGAAHPADPADFSIGAGADDVTIELEREELGQLLDRALALLPAPTRAVLVAHFMEDSPHAEIAARLGVSEGAVAVRIHRGKVALRTVLAQELAVEAEPYGVAAHANDAQATRIWCPFCGMDKLKTYVDIAADEVHFYCPACLHIAGTRYHSVVDGVRSPKAMLSRQLTLLNDFYRTAITHRRVACIRCGAQAESEPRLLQEGELPAAYRGLGYGVRIECPACGWVDANSLQYLAFDLPETQQFWKAHPRMRVLPEVTVERDNRLVVVSRFESISDNAALNILTVAETLEITR